MKDKGYVALFLAPALALITVFMYYPILRNVYYSFTEFDGYTKAYFVGLDNYKRLFTDPIVGKALVNTLILLVSAIIFEVGLAIVLAIAVYSLRFGQRFFRTVFFFPVVISGTAIGIMFSLMYGYNAGMLNNFLVVMGLERNVWLTEKSALALVIIPTVWQYVGLYFVVMLSAIGRIPRDVYDSASIDGAKGIVKALKITIPLTRDVIATVILLVITGVLKTFDTVWVITRGGPLNATELLSTYMYRKAFTDQAYSYGSTISVLVVVLGVLLALIVRKLVKKDAVTY